jgi:hypothetical protein
LYFNYNYYIGELVFALSELRLPIQGRLYAEHRELQLQLQLPRFFLNLIAITIR